jgi:hypothetical protein
VFISIKLLRIQRSKLSVFTVIILALGLPHAGAASRRQFATPAQQSLGQRISHENRRPEIAAEDCLTRGVAGGSQNVP